MNLQVGAEAWALGVDRRVYGVSGLVVHRVWSAECLEARV